MDKFFVSMWRLVFQVHRAMSHPQLMQMLDGVGDVLWFLFFGN